MNLSGTVQVEEQEKELNVVEASGVHHSTVLKAQERALQERQLEIEAAREEMASNVSLPCPPAVECVMVRESRHLSRCSCLPL